MNHTTRSRPLYHPPLRVALVAAILLACPVWAAAPDKGAGEFKPLPGPGEKCVLDGQHTFTYQFSEAPKMGTVILKIQVFDAGGKQVSPFAVTGSSDMPSMRGAHSSGDQKFKTNRRGDYLLPLDIVMPGGWEVRLTFSKDGKPVFQGSLKFDV